MIRLILVVLAAILEFLGWIRWATPPVRSRLQRMAIAELPPSEPQRLKQLCSL